MSGGIALHASWLKAALQIVIDAASWINLTADGGGLQKPPIAEMVFSRHAKKREPGNLVPGHFWSKIRYFSEIKDLKK